MKKKALSFVIICLLCTAGLMLSANFAHADDVNKVVILGASIDTGSVEGFIQLAVAIAKWILGITGSVALLMFVYGGTLMIVYSGESKSVQQGKEAIKNAIIGLVIVFASYTIVSYVITSLGGSVKKDNKIEITMPKQ